MKKLIIICCWIASFLIACTEEFNGPMQGDGEVGAPVSNVMVKNTAGGAILTFDLPKDPNLQYVLAEVPVKNGKIASYKSSAYNDRIEIIGLPDEMVRKVKLYVVSKSEKKSNPLEVDIKPLRPPYQQVFNTIAYQADFGGVNVKYDNPTGADLAIMLETNDNGIWKPFNGYYSFLKEGNYTFRGMVAEPTKFALYIRDRWDNSSDTAYFSLTPLYEKMLDKSLFKDLTLPGDAPIYTTEWNIAKRFIWDGNWSSDFNNPYGNWLNVSTNAPNDGQPTHITFDLGAKAKLSRFRINHYYRYIDRGMRKYEIWGRTDAPKDGSWDGWVKMISYEQKKPSGLPGESYTAEDAEAWLRGDNGDFSSDLPPVRYIRIKCFENWVGTTNLNFAEITFWGDDKF